MKKFLGIEYLFILNFIFLPLSNLWSQENCKVDHGIINIELPAVNAGIKEEGFDVPPIWNNINPVYNETIKIPNGRPIYALIVSGYASNQYLDEIMLYDFVRSILDKGGYVHYSWWNNLLAPYMERPLHSSQSQPGNLRLGNLLSGFTTAAGAREKAMPGEDYQFVADAKIFLKAIRFNNPDAIIVVAGHSMGGGAVVHLADELSKEPNPIQIDILAPLDPVGNRNLPWAGVARQPQLENQQYDLRDYNFTRWRVSRDGFRGYKKTDRDGVFGDCLPTGGWLESPPSGILNCGETYFDKAPAIVFGKNIINLHHRYQQEDKFPYDYTRSYHFNRGDAPPEAFDLLNEQKAVPMKGKGDDDLGGWPRYAIKTKNLDSACCTSGEDGDGWDRDGHGEIIGYRGPVFERNPANGSPVPLGIRLKTSPQCGDGCENLSWPLREYASSTDEWGNGNRSHRKGLLEGLESRPLSNRWAHEPKNSSLCLVSPGLISLLNNIMPDPPIANAGEDQVAECTGPDGTMVTLDGSGSERAECYEWNYVDVDGNPATESGVSITINQPLGINTIELVVTDMFGRTDNDEVIVEIIDTTPPELKVSLNPNLLWPPNHKFVDINAMVEATDLCGGVDTILYSIVASEADNVIGSGNTSPDIAGANFNTEDLLFKLRAERSGKNKKRIYTVTYKATDDSGNFTYTSKEVVVENPSNNNVTARVENSVIKTSKGIFNGNVRNYPNPLKSTTRIEYSLAKRDYVKVVVYDMKGVEVSKILSEIKESGVHSVIFDGSELAPGIYICKFTSGNQITTLKMVVDK